MADFVWVGDISADWNDIGNWRDGATGAPVVSLPGVTDDVHFGEWIGGGAPWGQNAFISPAGVSVNNVYLYGAGSGGFAPYLGELDVVRSFSLDLQGTLTCEEIYCLSGAYATPYSGGGGEPTALTLTGPAGINASSVLLINGGTYSNTGDLSGATVVIKGSVLNPDLLASSVVVSGGLGISAEGATINQLTFSAPTQLLYSSAIYEHDFNEINIITLNINANVSSLGNTPTIANEHLFLVDTVNVQPTVTTNECRLKPVNMALGQSIVCSQSGNNRYGKLVVASAATVTTINAFTGYGDLVLEAGSLFNCALGSANEIGSFIGPGNVSHNFIIGNITTNGGSSGVFSFDVFDNALHAATQITLDTFVGSHSPASVDVVLDTGSEMRLPSFTTNATTCNFTAASSAEALVVSGGTLTGSAFTSRSVTFNSSAIGFTSALKIRPNASTTTIYDAQVALTTTSGVVTLYPYALPLGNSTYSYTINGNITSHTVGAFPFVVDLSGGFENYSIACNSTSFSSFTSTVLNSFDAKTLTFTYTNSCFIGDLIITGGAAATTTYHNSFIHQTGTASTDRISLFSSSGITIPSHGATRLQTQGEGQLWFRNAGDTDFNSVTLQSGSQTNETNNSIRLSSTTSRAISSANTFIFESGAEFILAAGMATNCSIETRLNQPTAPALSSEFHFYCDDAAVITFEDGDLQEDFYINTNIITGNHMAVRYPLAANAPRVPAFAPDGPSNLHINGGQIVYGALVYPATYDHTVSSVFVSTRHKGYAGDTRKSLDIRGTVSPGATFSANLDSTTTVGEVRFDNAVANSPGFYLSCQASRTIAVEFTGSFTVAYARLAGTGSTYTITNSAGTNSTLTVNTYGFDSRGTTKVTWDSTLAVYLDNCPFRVENTNGWENTVDVKALSGLCSYTFPHSIISAYKDCPIIAIDAGAQLHPTATGQVAHSLTGPGTFNWRGLVAAPADVEFYLVALGGNLDSAVVYAQQDSNCHLKIIAYATPATQPVLLAGTYTFPIYIGYATGTTTTGDLIVTSIIATSFYGGLHLNYNQMTPTDVTHIAGGFTSASVIVRVETMLNVYAYGQLGGGSQTNIVDASGVIEYTASHDAVKAVNTINVIATTENCVFTGIGFMAAQEFVIAGVANTYLVELPNIKAHDGSTGDFYVGQYPNGTMKPVSATWNTAYVNHVIIGTDSIIHRRGGTQIPQSQFVGTMTRSHVYTDKNETAKTITHGENFTYYGTSSFGRVTVESGQDLEFAQFGVNNGVIMDSLLIQGNTTTMNANTIRILGESVNDRTLEADNAAVYKAPGYSATNYVTTQIYEHGSTNPYNIIELDDTATVELGSQNDTRSTVVFDSDVSNVSCIAVASGETLKLRNCVFKTDGIDADEVIFSAIGSAPVVEVSGCTCNITHTFAKVFHDTNGTIKGCTLENTVNQPLIKFGDSSATSSVQSGTLEFKQNYLKNATAADTLIEMTGTWYWNKFEYNHAVFSGQTGTGISQAIKISSDQAIGSNTNPMKHWSFSIPSNFGPVRADDRMLRGTHCNLATTNSEVGNYASTNQNQIFSAVNGANRQSMMLGGNQINGELEIEVLKYIAQWDASVSGLTFVQNDGETYLTNPTRTLSFVDSVFFAYNPNDTYSVSWVDLDADNPVTVKPIFEYRNGNTPGSASNLTNGGNLPTTPSGIRVYLRVQLPELTSGFKDLVVTNTTQSTVVFSEYWPYKPAMSTDLIPSTDSSFKITGTEAYDSTTIFPSKSIAPHTVELRPNKPRYEISIDRSDLSTDNQYHIMFGYQDNDNYYVARFHMLSATTVRCQLWKKVNGTTSQVGTNVNYTVGASIHVPVDFGFTWTPGTNIRWRVDGSDGATEAITDFLDGAVGFETRNCFAKRVSVYETKGFTARNTDLYFSSGHVYTPITNGINLYNCTVNMNAAALFPDLIATKEDTIFEQTTFADASLTNYINGFMELRGMEIQLPGDILLGETGKLHMYGCILYRANNARWKIDTRGISYANTPPIKIRSCQLRGIYTTILKDGDLTVLDDASLGSYLIRIYARKEMRVKRNRVLGLDFSRSITDGFQSTEQDVEMHVVNNMVIPGKLDTYWRDQEVFEFISPYCYEWKGKIVAYRTAILEVANVATQVRFTVEEWRDD